MVDFLSNFYSAFYCKIPNLNILKKLCNTVEKNRKGSYNKIILIALIALYIKLLCTVLTDYFRFQ